VGHPENRAMSDPGRRKHWDDVYRTKAERELSWFQARPDVSLQLLRQVGATQRSALIDVGGGASRLVDCVIRDGYDDVTVLDLSATALGRVQSRIGEAAKGVTWIVADVTTWEPARTYDVWHDRAALHFLTDAADQAAYAARLRRALRPGGHVIIGTFALDGPERCSGLPVQRYDASHLTALLGDGFELVDTRQHEHATPWGAVQKFQFSSFRFRRD
jgi:SAM-dependent methyltransferase